MKKFRRPSISLDSENGRQLPSRGGVARDTRNDFMRAGQVALAMLDEIRKRKR